MPTVTLAPTCRAITLAVAAVMFSPILLHAQIIGNFPDPAFPPENPSSPAKIQLGKALFFDEQLSSDNTMACATCHLPEAGGAELRAAVLEPGDDGVLGTLDDNLGSPGMISQDAGGNYQHDPVVGVEAQPTNRNAPTVYAAAFFGSLFWDMRAGPVFRDEAGSVVLSANAALESQAVGPPTSSVEMAHGDIDWVEITQKLSRVLPLRLASNLPQELATFVGNSVDYGPLFQLAFGDPAITRERVAMAIATYERTLVPDQSPFDRGSMTPQQAAGLDVFTRVGVCGLCHTVRNGLFTSGRSHSIGLPNHVRFVKTPTLRNVGLRKRYMHSGQFASLEEVVAHYEQLRFFVSPLSVQERLDLLEFLRNGLTDPRVVAQQPPFDRPTLYSEIVPPGSTRYGLGSPGTGGFVPRLITASPPNVGHAGFKLGVGLGLGGSVAAMLLSAGPSTPPQLFIGLPIHVELNGAVAVSVPLSAAPAGRGVGTLHLPSALTEEVLGGRLFAQAMVLDPNANMLLAATEGASFEVFSAGVTPQ